MKRREFVVIFIILQWLKIARESVQSQDGVPGTPGKPCAGNQLGYTIEEVEDI